MEPSPLNIYLFLLDMAKCWNWKLSSGQFDVISIPIQSDYMMLMPARTFTNGALTAMISLNGSVSHAGIDAPISKCLPGSHLTCVPLKYIILFADEVTRSLPELLVVP